MPALPDVSDQQSASNTLAGPINVRAAYGRIWKQKPLLLWLCAYILSTVVAGLSLLLLYLLGRAIVLSLPRALEELATLGELGTAVKIFASVKVLLPLVAVLPIVAWGTTRLLLNIVDGDGKFSDLWSLLTDDRDAGRAARWTRTGKFLSFQCAYYVICDFGGVIILLGLLTTNTTVVSIGLLTAMVWWAVRIRFSFTYLYMVDQGCGGFEALRRSWRATRHQWIRFATLVLVVPLVFILAFTMAYALLASVILEGIEMSGRVVGKIDTIMMDENGNLYFSSDDIVWRTSQVVGQVVLWIAWLGVFSISQMAIGIAYRQAVPK